MSKTREGGRNSDTLNWFDFNDNAPTFARFGDAQGALHWATAVVSANNTSASQREHAAVLAARLAIPRLATLAKCGEADLRGLAQIVDTLASLERTLAARLKKRGAGHPHSDDNDRIQAMIVIAADWLAHLRPRPLSRQKADAIIANLIPDKMIARKKGGLLVERLSKADQLSQWRNDFKRSGKSSTNSNRKLRGSVARRHKVFGQVYDDLMEKCFTQGRAPRDYSADQVLSWLCSELN